MRNGINCDFDVGSNFDFGASPLLIRNENRGDLILAGQKSGMLFAIDPDDGSMVWERRIGKGGEHGGVHWSLSSDGKQVFVPVGDIGDHPKAIGKSKSGVYAFDPYTGEQLWSYEAKSIWEFDTRREFQGINSIPAVGGTIDATGPVISKRMIYINSGYGGYGKLAGNALIAFEIID